MERPNKTKNIIVNTRKTKVFFASSFHFSFFSKRISNETKNIILAKVENNIDNKNKSEAIIYSF